MSTTLSPDFLRSVIIVSSFRGDDLDTCCAALLFIGLRVDTFTGADIPAELTNGSKTLAGCAVGSLVAQELIEATGVRVKSPHPDAKGRKVNEYRIPANRVSTARSWLHSRGYTTETAQTELLLTA